MNIVITLLVVVILALLISLYVVRVAFRLLVERVTGVLKIAKEHRYRYASYCNDDFEYWPGRRDEAGWIADKLEEALYLKEEKP